MREELEKKVRNHLKKKKAFTIIGVCYIGVSILLFIISTAVHPGGSTRFWINFPSIIMLLVLALIYVSMFGLRKMEDALYDEEDEVEEAIARLYEYKTEEMTPRLDLKEEERLELKELERMKEKIKRN